jgi:hypothetical protein
VYSSCISCSADLGRNAVIGSFPLGRRLAFDAERGRLWVVCGACGRWNLSALEDRWEAIEACERLFAGTRLRVSTDNVGLARVPEGLELVRVGRALVPELAAWRYAGAIALRRRRTMLASAASFAALAATGYGIAAVSVGGVGGAAWLGLKLVGRQRVVARVPTDAGTFLVRHHHLEDVGWHPEIGGTALMVAVRSMQLSGEVETVAEASGHQARLLLVRSLARLNRRAGTPAQITGALRVLDHHGDPLRSERFADWYGHDVMLRRLSRVFRPHHDRVLRDWRQAGHRMTLALLPPEFRLAVEMAANEETERRAVEGELAGLELAWREAEEIAAIADGLLVPPAVRERLRGLRER